MAKKRKRRTSTALSVDRERDLIGGMYALLTGQPARHKLFDSDLQRRSVYFANKEKLIDETLDLSGPGARPDSFYEYETDIDISQDRERIARHRYLIENNLLFEGELEGLIADYLFTFEKLKSTLKYNDNLFDIYKQRAHLYGGAALESWNQYFTKQEVKK